MAVKNNSISVEGELNKRKQFSDREVGINHPDNNSFMRMNDQGDIEIFAAPGIGIIISSKSKSISLFGDTIKFHSKEDGLKWNSYRFNYAASSYSEPTLVKIDLKEIHSAQNGAAYYLNTIKMFEEEEKQKPITISPENKFSNSNTMIEQNIKSENDLSDLTVDQVGLLEIYSSSYSKDHIDLMIKYMRLGFTFEQSHQKATKDLNE